MHNNHSKIRVNGVLGHDTALARLYWTTWANEMNFVMNRPVVQQSYAIPLYHGCPPHNRIREIDGLDQ